MSHYQGRALERATSRRPPGPSGVLAKVLRVVTVMGVMGLLAMVPWKQLRRRFAIVDHVRVSGLRYLDAERVRKRAGLRAGQDLLSLDLSRTRQLVMLDPRVESARVKRSGLRGVEVMVRERVPALVVLHGEPWEVDTTGVLLEPLQRGVVADVPMLTGADYSRYKPGTQLRTQEVQRGLAWTAALGDNALRLAGQVSEVDVSDARTTRLVLLNGIRVVGPTWPVSTRQLSGLRATLADLEHKGMKPREVDVRFEDQIIVREAEPAVVATTVRTSISL
ncbi:MAG: FtsQ-type POTRA domain-containing protein [Candidatus Eisenbacteria bacterium]